MYRCFDRDGIVISGKSFGFGEVIKESEAPFSLAQRLLGLNKIKTEVDYLEYATAQGINLPEQKQVKNEKRA